MKYIRLKHINEDYFKSFSDDEIDSDEPINDMLDDISTKRLNDLKLFLSIVLDLTSNLGLVTRTSLHFIFTAYTPGSEGYKEAIRKFFEKNYSDILSRYNEYYPNNAYEQVSDNVLSELSNKDWMNACIEFYQENYDIVSTLISLQFDIAHINGLNDIGTPSPGLFFVNERAKDCNVYFVNNIVTSKKLGNAENAKLKNIPSGYSKKTNETLTKFIWPWISSNSYESNSDPGKLFYSPNSYIYIDKYKLACPILDNSIEHNTTNISICEKAPNVRSTFTSKGANLNFIFYKFFSKEQVIRAYNESSLLKTSWYNGYGNEPFLQLDTDAKKKILKEIDFEHNPIYNVESRFEYLSDCVKNSDEIKSLFEKLEIAINKHFSKLFSGIKFNVHLYTFLYATSGISLGRYKERYINNGDPFLKQIF